MLVGQFRVHDFLVFLKIPYFREYFSPLDSFLRQIYFLRINSCCEHVPSNMELFDVLFSIDIIVFIKEVSFDFFTKMTMSIENKKASGSSFSLY